MKYSLLDVWFFNNEYTILSNFVNYRVRLSSIQSVHVDPMKDVFSDACQGSWKQVKINERKEELGDPCKLRAEDFHPSTALTHAHTTHAICILQSQTDRENVSGHFLSPFIKFLIWFHVAGERGSVRSQWIGTYAITGSDCNTKSFKVYQEGGTLLIRSFSIEKGSTGQQQSHKQRSSNTQTLIGLPSSRGALWC